MNSTIQLLNRVRGKTETGSDYAVAKLLGITPQRMSKYIHGENQLEDDFIIAKAAELIGENPAALLAEFRAEKTKDEKTSKYWYRLATLARAAAPAAIVAGVILSPPSPASFSNASATYIDENDSHDVYYVKL